MAKLYAKSPSGEDALLSISITGFTQSLQQNGWCKLPNGLLLQWSKPNVKEWSYRDTVYRFGSSIYYEGYHTIDQYIPINYNKIFIILTIPGEINGRLETFVYNDGNRNLILEFASNDTGADNWFISNSLPVIVILCS